MSILNAGQRPAHPPAANSQTGRTLNSEWDSRQFDEQSGTRGPNPFDLVKLFLASCFTALSGFAALSVLWASPSTESDCEPAVTLAADDSRQAHVTREQELHRLTQLWMRSPHCVDLTHGYGQGGN